MTITCLCHLTYSSAGSHQRVGDIQSHSRAIDLFVESLADNKFVAQKCPSNIDLLKEDQFKNCHEGTAVFGGEHKNLTNVPEGIYYFITNDNPSYGRGI